MVKTLTKNEIRNLIIKEPSGPIRRDLWIRDFVIDLIFRRYRVINTYADEINLPSKEEKAG